MAVDWIVASKVFVAVIGAIDKAVKTSDTIRSWCTTTSVGERFTDMQRYAAQENATIQKLSTDAYYVPSIREVRNVAQPQPNIYDDSAIRESLVPLQRGTRNKDAFNRDDSDSGKNEGGTSESGDRFRQDPTAQLSKTKQCRRHDPDTLHAKGQTLCRLANVRSAASAL